MKNNDHKNTELTDFKELDDRVFAQHPSSPTFVIKTNLDPDDATSNNPYYKKGEGNKEKFEDYFEE
ncbi:hypothetical protein [Cytobacillus purgationiresistens]|uniref:Uncharacterized protein n=1 Tax=Cytobacillus purgationiresistens TaxID=863449 RepID=A0ABU0AE72_9BACI|nr:hypothetical protein [Cytobacillus purgationiresistens]MDQ0268385.1 hypothetical protein [Cytobacillus purgationiresistens]